jgi:hypothetical protein
MDFSLASVVPRRVGSPAEARAEVAASGAAILPGLGDQDAALAAGRAVLGGRCRRFGPQFEATKSKQEAEAAEVDEQPADERGRKRRFTATRERMVPHNDGFGFGDFGPDYLFLWCGRPDAAGGGESFLIDGARLLELMAADPEYAQVAAFCWETVIDQSVQVRHHPFQAPVPGQPAEAERAQAALIGQWSRAVSAARDSGPMFPAGAGELICVDNYRLTHGRDAFSDPDRVMLSIWGWSDSAIAVPEGPLDIVRPVVPRALAGDAATDR